MKNETNLSPEHRSMIAGIIAADDKVAEWQGTADERWQAVMLVALSDEATGEAMRAEYVAKRVARAARDKGEALTDEERDQVTRSAKNVWKSRKSNAKRGGRANVDQVTTKGATERAGDARAAIRRALAAGVSVETLRTIIDEVAAKLG